MRTIDLNCDMGEGYPDDAELMKLISSANIACGYHAGDIDTMRRTVELAISNNVAIGAHPGYADRENFGRRGASLTTAAVSELIQTQVYSMLEVCREFGAAVHHVKPHGALYNQAAKDAGLARAIANAVRDIDDKLIFYGLSGSFLISQAELSGLRTASEVFADRTYAPDGTLTPRSEPNALIDDPSVAAERAAQMVENGVVITTAGSTNSLRADTICIHGDGPRSVEFAVAIRASLDARNITVTAM